MSNEIKQKDLVYKLIFLQIKLSVTEKLSSFYTEILSFIVQYSFIFDESPTKTKPLTPDPARDGSNWYGYAGQNPLIYVDPTELAYYTGPTGSSVQSSNTPVTPHDFSETRGPSGGPAGTPKAPETPKQTDTALYNDLWDYLWDYGPDLLDFKDGWEKGYKSLGLTLLDNILDISLRKEINGDYEGSLYFQKYINQIQEYKEIDFVFNNFLNIQRNKLNYELDYNSEYYFSNYVFSNFNGKIIDIDKNQYISNSIPLPGINYLGPTYR